MIFVAIAVALVGIPALIILALRQWGQQDARTETRLHQSQTHTASYDVPAGQDPAPLRTALNHASFSTVLGHGDAGRSLIVECDEADRARVRNILEQELPRHAIPVHFQDESV
ncbi:hypothetical protein [Nocardioides cynanchi]|uniref:hypothetical protein n=1 Tax=Nocardioides cynanchi TaxID=2558918 RepID=UPI001247BF3E|nr:hypothetical protein [Nocardioides cynanchi]